MIRGYGGTPYEMADKVVAHRVDDRHRGMAVQHIEPRADQPAALLGEIPHYGCEVGLSLQPWLDHVPLGGGDVTQSNEDPKVRCQRLREFREQLAALRVGRQYYFAGEHDAALDRGEAHDQMRGSW